MIRDLLTVRLTRTQFAGIAILSILVSALIIANATGQSGGAPRSELLALLHRGPIIHHVGDPSPAGDAASGDRSSGGSSSGTGPAAGAPGSGSAASAAVSSTNSGASVSAGTGSVSAGTGSTTAGSGSTTTGAGKTASTKAVNSKIKHVFIIELTTTSYAAAFGPHSVARYLNRTLKPKGTLLPGYRSLGGSELPDELAMVSGQAPNADTRGNCSVYGDFRGGAKPDKAGLVPGNGCVYPNTVITLGDQVTASGATWRAYIDGMGDKETCIHPNSGARDDALLPFAGDEYDTRHNPFIYFHSLVDLGDCTTDDMDLSALPKALRSPFKTAKLSYIAPSLCDDAASSACPDGNAGGLAGEDAFLRTWVPRILSSSAYRHSGMLMIVFAPSRPDAAAASDATGATGMSGSAGTTGATGATSPVYTPVATSASARPMRTGVLLLSPFARRGRTVAGAYDPYSILRSVEDLFGFTALGHGNGATSFVPSALPGA